jgi:hypothetical protein
VVLVFEVANGAEEVEVLEAVEVAEVYLRSRFHCIGSRAVCG